MDTAFKKQTVDEVVAPSFTILRFKRFFQTNLTAAGVFWHVYALILVIVAAGIWAYFR
jgi:succinate-acetate transporter protein